MWSRAEKEERGGKYSVIPHSYSNDFSVIIFKEIKIIFAAVTTIKQSSFYPFKSFINCQVQQLFKLLQSKTKVQLFTEIKGEITWNNSDTCTYQQMYILQYRIGMFILSGNLGTQYLSGGSCKKERTGKKKENQRVKLLQSAGFKTN